MYIGDPHRNRPFVKHLIGYYPFDSFQLVSGANVFEDKIQPKVNLYSPTNITTGAGVINNAVFCPAGTNSPLRNTGDPNRHKYSFTDGTNDLPFSISFHLKIISNGSHATESTIFEKGANGSSLGNTNAEYSLTINSASTQIRFNKFSQGAFANGIIYTITAPPLNTWNYWTITDDALGNVKIYINGVEQYKITTNKGTGFVKFSSMGSSGFGFFNVAGVTLVTTFVNGLIDDFGILKGYVLTQEDIDWIWNGGNPRRLKKVS